MKDVKRSETAPSGSLSDPRFGWQDIDLLTLVVSIRSRQRLGGFDLPGYDVTAPSEIVGVTKYI